MNPRRALVVAAPLLAVAASIPVPVPASAAASTVCVEIVVDYGQLYNGQVSATCVVVAKGSTGAQILDARATKLGVQKPRYRADGLLCAIDGKPAAPDCAEQTGDGGFKYWSYWHKQLNSSWKYAQSGPFDYSVTGDHPGEGWSWVEGQEKNSRPPAAVSYERVCPLTAPTPKSTSSKPTSTVGTSSPASSRSGSSSRQPTATVAPKSSTSAAASAAATGSTPSPAQSEVAISEPPRKKDAGGTPLTGVLAGAAVVVGVGGAAFWRARRATTQ
ncbi:MAG: hypothetical protein QOG53_3374 [Frankiales bacterium]|jgi:hypothetical protein|nr:hypothetical protein [Frankiales bacterium]